MYPTFSSLIFAMPILIAGKRRVEDFVGFRIFLPKVVLDEVILEVAHLETLVRGVSGRLAEHDLDCSLLDEQQPVIFTLLFGVALFDVDSIDERFFVKLVVNHDLHFDEDEI